MSNQIDITGGARVRGLNGVITGTTGVLNSLPINSPNGIPQLDVNGKILVSQLPNSVMEFLGTWNAATNTPTLADGIGNAGDVYLCNVAGTVNFGSGPITFNDGDYVVYSGTTWERSGGALGTVTSVAASITGNSVGITGSPITTAGTLAFAFAGTNLQYVNGAGNLTTFPTLITSIGLSMPTAFNVANSPLTANGTIAVTGAGTASQYIRGDGQLATFPTTGGGGSAIYYYLNGSIASSVAGYQQMANTAVVGAGTDFNLTGNGLIAQFLTDIGNPNRILIPSGAWNFEVFFSSSSNGGNEKFYLELVKYNGSTFTTIASTITNPEAITGGTTTDLYITSMAVPETTLLVTDRLAVRVYIVDNSGARTITLHTEDNNLCQITTTFSAGISSINGLTENTQYFAVGTSGMDFNINSLVDTHTFNLPTASATKRGALSSADWSLFNNKESGLSFNDPLFRTGNSIYIYQATAIKNGYLSSADWSTFNAKQNALTLTTTGTSGAATLVGATLNIPNYAPDLSGYVTLATTQTISGLKTFTSLLTAADFTNGFLTISGGTIDRTTTGTAIELQFAGNGPIRFFGSTAWPILFSSTSGIATFSNSITASSFIKSGGTSSQYLMADGSTSTLTNPVTGTGTTNYLPKFTGASTIGNSIISESGSVISVGGSLYSSGTLRLTGSSSVDLQAYTGSAYSNINYDAASHNWQTSGGTAKMVLNASGNLGLGVTPSAWVGLAAIQSAYGILSGNNQSNILLNSYYDGSYKYVGTGEAARYRQDAGSHAWLNAPSGTAGAAISFTQAMTLTASGRLLLGTASESTYLLDVNGTGRFSGAITAAGATFTAATETRGNIRTTFASDNSYYSLFSNDGALNLDTYGVGGYMNFKILGSTKLSIAATGAATFSSSVTAQSFDILKNGSSSFTSSFKLTSASGTVFSQNLQLGAGGSLDVYGWNGSSWIKSLSLSTIGQATLYNLAGTGSRAVLADANGLLSAPVSDISVKQNIKPIGYGLNEISKMNPVWFDFIDGYKNYGEGRQNGNIAQEMKAIIPEAVFTTPSTGKMGINYDQLHAVYIKAIQQLEERIKQLENK